MKCKRAAAMVMSLILAASVSAATAYASAEPTAASVSTAGTAVQKTSVRLDYAYYTTRTATAKSRVIRSYTSEHSSVVTLHDLNLPTVKEGSAISAGWSTVKTETIYETQAKAENATGFVKPDDNLIKLVSYDGMCTLYPVLRYKTADELDTEAAAEAKAEKVAVDENGTPISAAKVHVNIKALSGDEVSNALKVSGADAATSALYDISITDDNGGKVQMLDGKSIQVKLDRPKIDGNVNFKLYHIEGNQAKEVKITVDGDAILFRADSFSPYVLTWKIAARSSGAGNPLTGDDFNPVVFILIAVLAIAAGAAVLIVRNIKANDHE